MRFSIFISREPFGVYWNVSRGKTDCVRAIFIESRKLRWANSMRETFNLLSVPFNCDLKIQITILRFCQNIFSSVELCSKFHGFPLTQPDSCTSWRAFEQNKASKSFFKSFLSRREKVFIFWRKNVYSLFGSSPKSLFLVSWNSSRP